MRTLALVADSLREIYARKVIIGIVIIEVVALTITGLFLFSDGMQNDYDDARLAGDGAVIDTVVTDPAATMTREDSLLLGLGTSGEADSATTAEGSSGDSAGQAAPPQQSRTLEEVEPGSDAAAPRSDVILEEQVKGNLGAYATPVVLATIFLGIFATAGIIPSMMEKGTIDLLLSKPLPRWQLLWGRAFGGILAVAINLLLFTVAIWALYGVATGIWHSAFIGMTFLFAFTGFLIVYAGVMALNVATESWVLPVSLAYIHIILLANLLSSREESIFQWTDSKIVHGLVTGLHYALPQTTELVSATGVAVHTGTVLDWSPFLQGALFALAMLAFATWRFQRKDF